MKMRCTISLLLALLLALGAFSCAQAQTTSTGVYTLEDWSVSLNAENGVLYGSSRSVGGFAILSPEGQPISDVYGYMNRKGQHFEVISEEGLNMTGLIDSQGNVVLPQQYGAIDYISDRWQIGVKLVEATAENYDYTGSGNTYYLVEAYDVYFCGALAGTLGRMDYYQASAYGNYLYMRDRDGNYHYYNSAMQDSGYTTDYPSYNEYEETRSGIFHRGSNQQAFIPGCTLTADDVETDYYVINGRIVDVQGNELGYLPIEYGSAYDYGFEGEYCKIELNDKYGVIDKTGRVVAPCEYDDIGYSDTLFAFGYQIFNKDGKLGYADTNGNVTCEFKYAEGAWDNDYKTPLNRISDMEGNSIVLSGAVGELPERYADVYTQDGCPLFVAENFDGQFGVVDMYGQAVVPFSNEYDDMYDFNIAKDGSVVVAYNVDRVYKVYTFSYGQAASVVVETVPVVVEAAPVVVESAIADDGWTCTCGQANTGNFCPNCGATRPVVEETAAPASDGWICTCGQANTGNFCPNCGSARPAQKLVCAGCGFEPEEGTAPKFCMECGTAF